MTVKTAKIFTNGRSQAVRLPKEFRFEGKEVLIRREGDNIILSPVPADWRAFFEEVPLPTEDFMAERDQGVQQIREQLFD